MLPCSKGLKSLKKIHEGGNAMAKSHSQEQNKDLSQEEGTVTIINATANATDKFHKQIYLKEFYKELNLVLIISRCKTIARKPQ